MARNLVVNSSKTAVQIRWPDGREEFIPKERIREIWAEKNSGGLDMGAIWLLLAYDLEEEGVFVLVRE